MTGSSGMRSLKLYKPLVFDKASLKREPISNSYLLEATKLDEGKSRRRWLRIRLKRESEESPGSRKIKLAG
jgi:hypothetical protein